jgi:hypothetical protein
MQFIKKIAIKNKLAHFMLNISVTITKLTKHIRSEN